MENDKLDISRLFQFFVFLVCIVSLLLLVKQCRGNNPETPESSKTSPQTIDYDAIPAKDYDFGAEDCNECLKDFGE